MMDENEIKANYLDIYTDIFKLLENFEKVQRPTNDVVGKCFGTPLVAGMTLAEIKNALDGQKLINDVANTFFGVPATFKVTLSDINVFMTRQATLNTIANNFFGRKYVSDALLTGPTLAEIKRAIDEQKLTSYVVDKFSETHLWQV